MYSVFALETIDLIVSQIDQWFHVRVFHLCFPTSCSLYPPPCSPSIDRRQNRTAYSEVVLLRCLHVNTVPFSAPGHFLLFSTLGLLAL